MTLPNGWKKVKLGDCFDVQLGKMLNKNAREQEPQYPYVANVNVRWGSLNTERLPTMYFSEREKEKFALKKNDILMCEGGEIGRCTVLKHSLDNVFYQKACHRLRTKNNLCAPDYLYFYINHYVTSREIVGLVGESSIAHLPVEKVIQIQLNLPPIEEQKKIAATLSVWDTAIEKMEKLIEVLEERYQAYVNEFFFENQSERKKLKMGDVFAVRNDRSVATEDMPLYSLTIENGITAKTDRYDRGALVKDKDSKKYKIVCDGDVVYNPANLRWGAIGQSKVGHNVVVSPIYEVLYTRDNSNDSGYLSHYIMSKKMIAFYSSKTEGTLIERKEVKIDQFLRIDLYIEKDSVRQKKIADVLDMHQEEISNLKQQLENYKKQKQGLMQKLLTGEWRVK